MPNTVIPICTVLMKPTGFSIRASAACARRLPACASGSSRERRAVTSAYSAATKIAFPSTSSRITRIRSASLMR